MGSLHVRIVGVFLAVVATVPPRLTDTVSEELTRLRFYWEVGKQEKLHRPLRRIKNNFNDGEGSWVLSTKHMCRGVSTNFDDVGRFAARNRGWASRF